jgi:hypothetical protein
VVWKRKQTATAGIGTVRKQQPPGLETAGDGPFSMVVGDTSLTVRSHHVTSDRQGLAPRTKATATGVICLTVGYNSMLHGPWSPGPSGLSYPILYCIITRE